MTADRTSRARNAGRGVVWITAAKLYFILTGVALITLLPKFIGTDDAERAGLYGTFTVVTGILNPLTMMMITGTIQAVSKFISEDETRLFSVRREALKLQAFFGGILALAFAAAAPLIAWLLHDDALTPPLRIGAIILFCYSLYAVLIGAFNGRRRFDRQAQMDTLFATMKTGLILLLCALGLGVTGAMAGFAATSVLMLGVAWIASEKRAGSSMSMTQPVTWRMLLRFEVTIVAFALVSNLLMNVDLYLVKALGPGATEVGIYSVALQVARLPYIATLSVTFVIFPLISEATWSGDQERVKTYISTTLRYAAIFAGWLAIVLAACASDVLRLVFDPIFHRGAGVLTILSFSYFGFSLLIIASAILSGSGNPVHAVLLAAATLALSLVFTSLGITFGGLEGAALGSALAMLSGALTVLILLHLRFSAPIPWSSIVRLTAVGSALWALGIVWRPEAEWLIILKGLGFFLSVPVLLAALGELTKKDLKQFHVVTSQSKPV